MNRFARIMQTIGILGSIALIFVWIQGLEVGDIATNVARHTTLALGAASGCLLSHLWAIAFLGFSARGRRQLLLADNLRMPDASGQREVARWRRLAVTAAAFAILLLGASFALGGAALLRRVAPAVHAGIGAAAVLAQLVALAVERRALRLDQSQVAALDLPLPVSLQPQS
ncbi:MAG: hypothetical protein ABI639_07275 [Thermoanaerobaculia bacterium]